MDYREEDIEIIANANILWERFEKKTILISGATGYVPQYLVHGFMRRNDLYNAGIKMIVLCRSQGKAHERFREYYNRTDFVLLIQDILTPIRYEGKIDFIIHAASPAGLVGSNKEPVETFKVNVWGADNLLQLSKEKGAEFLLFSSVDVYGKGDGDRFVEGKLCELDTLDCRNVYAYSKRAAENLCACYTKKGVNVKIVRPSQIMGGGIDLKDGRLHIDFISQMLLDKKIVLKGDGSPIRSFIYITDAIVGILKVLTCGNAGEAYNICNEGCERSVLELAQIMASCSKQPVAICFNQETRTKSIEVRHAISVVTASSEKLRMLGWEPTIGIEEACRRMMAYYGLDIK